MLNNVIKSKFFENQKIYKTFIKKGKNPGCSMKLQQVVIGCYLNFSQW